MSIQAILFTAALIFIALWAIRIWKKEQEKNKKKLWRELDRTWKQNKKVKMI